MAQHRSFMTAFHTRGVVSLYDFSCEALHTRTYLPSSTPTTLRARSVIFTSRQDFCRIPGVDPGSVLEVTSPDSWEKVLPSRLTGKLRRDYSVMVSNFGCMVSCYVQLANSRAPVLAHNALALFPRGSLQVIYTASVDHTTAPTPKVCERSMASTTRALIAHPACSTSLQEVYVPWSIWSRLYITSNVAKTELLDELTLGLEFQDVVILLSMPTFYVGVLILLPIVESVFDKHRESIPFSCSVAIAVLALFIGYLAEWSLDFALDNIADPFPIISIALAGGLYLQL